MLYILVKASGVITVNFYQTTPGHNVQTISHGTQQSKYLKSDYVGCKIIQLRDYRDDRAIKGVY
jgi:hypothetical protein